MEWHYTVVGKSMNAQAVRMVQMLGLLLTVCPWASDLISLFFSFLLHLVEVPIVRTIVYTLY